MCMFHRLFYPTFTGDLYQALVKLKSRLPKLQLWYVLHVWNPGSGSIFLFGHCQVTVNSGGQVSHGHTTISAAHLHGESPVA